MGWFPQEMPAPEPNRDDAGFWASCNRQQLAFQCCADCGQLRHPPTPVCPRCRSLQAHWKPSTGEGEVYSYTVIHHASHEAVRPRLPYTVGVIRFDDSPGVRLVTNVTHVPPAQVRIGLRVRLWWDEIEPGVFLPRVRPAGPDAGPDR